MNDLIVLDDKIQNLLISYKKEKIARNDILMCLSGQGSLDSAENWAIACIEGRISINEFHQLDKVEMIRNMLDI